MKDEFLGGRGRALEDMFFKKAEAERLEKLREQDLKNQLRKDLRDTSSIEDEGVLNHLLTLGITSEVWSALSILPLVLVAWADGEVDEKEKSAIMHCMIKHGIEEDSPAAERIHYWLSNPIPNELVEAWKQYISSICKELSPNEIKGLRMMTLTRARTIAEQTGGILGLGNKISKSEEEVLSKLETSFPS